MGEAQSVEFAYPGTHFSDVQFSATGSIAGKQIAPMLLLPFVENAFKHGVSTETKDAWIRIDVKVTDEQLVLLVENCKCTDKASSSSRDMASGIGLKNLQRVMTYLIPAAEPPGTRQVSTRMPATFRPSISRSLGHLRATDTPRPSASIASATARPTRSAGMSRAARRSAPLRRSRPPPTDSSLSRTAQVGLKGAGSPRVVGEIL